MLPNLRWSVWRKYEDFYETYLALHDKYVGTHQAIRYTKLHSLRRLKKLHKKDNYQGLASTNNSMWGMGEMESTSANDVRDDSKEFIEMPFLQKLQVCLKCVNLSELLMICFLAVVGFLSTK